MRHRSFTIEPSKDVYGRWPRTGDILATGLKIINHDLKLHIYRGSWKTWRQFTWRPWNE
jgi:hypothetical protein